MSKKMLSLSICAVYGAKRFENEVNGYGILISKVINPRHFCNKLYDTLNALLIRYKMKKEGNKKLYGNTTVFASFRHGEKVMNCGIENL